MSKWRALIFIALVPQLAWFGGVGCNGNSETLEVIETSPLDGANNVPLAATIQARFNQGVNPATVDLNTFTLTSQGGGSVTGNVSYDSNTSTAIFTPSSSLAAGTTYTATLSTGIEANSGSPLPSNYVWSFTTLAWFSVDGQVSAVDAESEDPVMLPSLPMVGYRHVSYQIALNEWDSSSWGNSKGDPSGNNFKAFYGAPNFCEDGNIVYTAFSHAGDPASPGASFYDHVLAYSWDSANGFQPMNGGNEISYNWPGNIWDANEATIACRESDNPVVGWVEAANATPVNAVVAEVSAAGANRSGFISRNNDVGSYATDVDVIGISADAGNIYVAQWEHDATDQNRTDLYVTRLAIPPGAQTNLGGKLDQDFNDNNLCAPSVIQFGSDLVVAYSAERVPSGGSANTRHIYVQRWDGANWSFMGNGPVTAYEADRHFESNHPSLALANGVLYLAWQETDAAPGGNTSLFVAHWNPATQAWVLDEANKRIGEDVATPTLDPSLAYDPTSASLYIAFEGMIQGHSQIFVKRRDL